MTVARTLALGVMLSLGIASAAGGQSAGVTLNFSIAAINKVDVVGTASLIISTAIAGNAPATVTTTGLSWAVTTNQTGAKITAKINTVMPAGSTLTANLAPPTGAASAGAQALTTTAVDVVTGITKVSETGLTLTYTLSATPAAGVITSRTRIVTLTITGGT